MKSKKQLRFEKEWNEITLLKMFEIEVLNKSTNETDWIVFDIELHGITFYASHVSLTKQQEKSKKIAYVKHVCDIDFSIDKNLESLYEACVCDIMDSDFYDLAE